MDGFMGLTEFYREGVGELIVRGPSTSACAFAQDDGFFGESLSRQGAGFVQDDGVYIEALSRWGADLS